MEDSYHTRGAERDRAKTWKIDGERNKQLKRIADSLERLESAEVRAARYKEALEELKGSPVMEVAETARLALQPYTWHDEEEEVKP